MIKKIWNFIKGNIFVKNALLAIGIFLLLIIIALFSLNIYTHHGEQIIIPDVKGLQMSQAIPFFERNNLNYEIVDSVFDPHAAPGSIAKTNPDAGEKVKKNRNIYITINAYSIETVAIPEIRDLSQRQALAMLDAIGLHNVNVTSVSGAYRDLVIGLKYRGKDLSAGDRVPVNGRFELLVSSGAEEAVPDSVVIEGTPEESWF